MSHFLLKLSHFTSGKIRRIRGYYIAFFRQLFQKLPVRFKYVSQQSRNLIFRFVKDNVFLKIFQSLFAYFDSTAAGAGFFCHGNRDTSAPRTKVDNRTAPRGTLPRHLLQHGNGLFRQQFGFGSGNKHSLSNMKGKAVKIPFAQYILERLSFYAALGGVYRLFGFQGVDFNVGSKGKTVKLHRPFHYLVGLEGGAGISALLQNSAKLFFKH